LAFATTFLLAELYKINLSYSIAKYEIFYNKDIAEMNLESEYQHWKVAPSDAQLSYLQYPFLYPPASKTRLLHIDTTYHKIFTSLETPTDPFLIIKVNRDNIIQDTLSQLAKEEPYAYKKPLRIVFIGESGVDEGGPRKEFFQMVIKQMFKVDYGMFVLEKETNCWWFNIARGALNPNTPRGAQQDEYFSVGLVLGLAIYNSVILNVNFPLALYKKLLASCPHGSFSDRFDYKMNLKDVKNTFPTVGKNLQYLLDFEGDVESAFGQYFEVKFFYIVFLNRFYFP